MDEKMFNAFLEEYKKEVVKRYEFEKESYTYERLWENKTEEVEKLKKVIEEKDKKISELEERLMEL